MEQAILSTGVVLIGLTLVGFLIQILNQIRLMKIMNQLLRMEDRILNRLLITNQTNLETVLELPMEGTLVTMEDLILRDLEERMTGIKNMEMMMTDMTLPTPEEEKEKGH